MESGDLRGYRQGRFSSFVLMAVLIPMGVILLGIMIVLPLLPWLLATMQMSDALLHLSDAFFK